MPIPMDPAAKFIADLASGKLIRYGAVLKEAGTGRIVGHLKETGDMGSFLSSFVTSPFKVTNAVISKVANVAINPIGTAVDIGGHVINGYQIRGVQKSVTEVKELVEGLQLSTNIAAIASVAGLGVSIAGFAIVNNKLKKMDAKIDRIAGDIGIIKSVLSDLSISWEAMSSARFQTAGETLIDLVPH